MKKFLITGLSETVDEAALKTALEHFGPVHHIQIVRDGDSSTPAAIVEMPLTDAQAFALTTRITDIWHDGHRVNARLLLH